MSFSKVAKSCEICKKGTGIYTCPRCNRKYCSSDCYKSRGHELCSESFYKEWVESSVQNNQFSDTEKDNMFGILRKCNEELAESTNDELSMVDRFAGLNIDDTDEDVLWRNLSTEEKAEFKTLIEDEKNLEAIILIKEPWWTVTMLNLVSEVDEERPDKEDTIPPRPHYPLNVKKLSDITSKKPSACLQFNLINILYAYALLFRFYNCDLRDFLEAVVDFLFLLCPVLSEGKNYNSLEETIQDSIRLAINSELGVPVEFAKSIVNDVSSIIQGPSNAKPAAYILCALHDIELLLLEMKSLLESRKTADKFARKRLMPTVKKIEYFMSWSLEFEDSFLELVASLNLFMLPELLTELESTRPEESATDIVQKKPIIEEIE